MDAYLFFTLYITYSLMVLPALFIISIGPRIRKSNLKYVPGSTFLSVFVSSLGIITCSVLLAGCYGISRSLKVFKEISVVLLVLGLLKLTIGVIVTITAKHFENTIGSLLDEEIANRGSLYFVDELQVKYMCCGRKGKEDYLGLPLPNSCCFGQVEECTLDKAYCKGCEDAIKESSEPTELFISFTVCGLLDISLGLFSLCYTRKKLENSLKA